MGGQLSAEVRVTSSVPQGSALVPLLYLACVNNIWPNMESTIRLFADDCNLQKNHKKCRHGNIAEGPAQARGVGG